MTADTADVWLQTQQTCDCRHKLRGHTLVIIILYADVYLQTLKSLYSHDIRGCLITCDDDCQLTHGYQKVTNEPRVEDLLLELRRKRLNCEQRQSRKSQEASSSSSSSTTDSDDDRPPIKSKPEVVVIDGDKSTSNKPPKPSLKQDDEDCQSHPLKRMKRLSSTRRIVISLGSVRSCDAASSKKRAADVSKSVLGENEVGSSTDILKSVTAKEDDSKSEKKSKQKEQHKLNIKKTQHSGKIWLYFLRVLDLEFSIKYNNILM